MIIFFYEKALINVILNEQSIWFWHQHISNTQFKSFNIDTSHKYLFFQ